MEEDLDEAEGQEGEEWEEWDLCRSLFDNHISDNMDLNLDYMFRKFGFYFPDAEYLKDPEGLMKYLVSNESSVIAEQEHADLLYDPQGAKIQYGHVPLYTRGDDENAKQFRSLHAVQRHMVDTHQCRMVYEDAEEEYAQFYEYEAGLTGEGRQTNELIVFLWSIPHLLRPIAFA